MSKVTALDASARSSVAGEIICQQSAQFVAHGQRCKGKRYDERHGKNDRVHVGGLSSQRAGN